MRHFPLVIALALLLAAPAQAGVTSKKSEQDPDAVRAFWTEERMKSAKPATRTRGGEPQAQAPKAGGSSGGWSTLKVNWPAAPPILKAHGKVFFTDGAYRYVCSGTAVSSTSGSVVWTAGHCVNNGGPSRFFTNWLFVPAYDNGVKPYGEWVASKLYTTDEWAQTGEFGRDVGAARVGLLDGQTLDQRLGGNVRSLAVGSYATGATANPIDSYGYPAEGKFNGQTMWQCDSYVSRIDTNPTPDTVAIPCGMNGGSSGGGWVNAAGAVASVNSYGYNGVKNTMFGPFQDNYALDVAADADAGL